MYARVEDALDYALGGPRLIPTEAEAALVRAIIRVMKERHSEDEPEPEDPAQND